MMQTLDRTQMQPSMKVAIRVGRRRARRAHDWNTVRACNIALRDPDIVDELLERLIDIRGDEIAAKAIGDGTFLDWLIENWESILKMIMDIIDLFG